MITRTFTPTDRDRQPGDTSRSVRPAGQSLHNLNHSACIHRERKRYARLLTECFHLRDRCKQQGRVITWLTIALLTLAGVSAGILGGMFWQTIGGR